VKDVVVLAGPNGAGKTTAAHELVPDRLAIREFVNADDIARGLSPFNPEGAAVAAGRLMIERMRGLAGAGQSFAFETTCAGRAHLGFLERCKKDGWRVSLVYLWLPSPDAALARVAKRIRQGGHRVPPHVVVRRYWAGLVNMFNLYLPAANIVAIYDNSDQERVLIAERTVDTALRVIDGTRWAAIERAANDRSDG
jgi:predicted ABC-type ATPase